jgi:hypothetical protein
MSGNSVQDHYAGDDTGSGMASRILAAVRAVHGSDAAITPGLWHLPYAPEPLPRSSVYFHDRMTKVLFAPARGRGPRCQLEDLETYYLKLRFIASVAEVRPTYASPHSMRSKRRPAFPCSWVEHHKQRRPR